VSTVRPEEYQLPELRVPILVQLGLTYRCNLRCAHCYALYKRDKNEFTLDELRALADELVRAGSAAVVYSHGENMIRRDFHAAATIFRERGFYQTLMLNGFFVREPADAERLIDAGINRTMVSIDSSDPEVHDRVRGQAGAFDRATTDRVADGSGSGHRWLLIHDRRAQLRRHRWHRRPCVAARCGGRQLHAESLQPPSDLRPLALAALQARLRAAV